ncbi:hypothetical protein GG344DRAFT_80012 [Lentinula edodes]|nr:hypothetical protein GG344DRAFT_80012 [Lentinula edodes]
MAHSNTENVVETAVTTFSNQPSPLTSAGATGEVDCALMEVGLSRGASREYTRLWASFRQWLVKNQEWDPNEDVFSLKAASSQHMSRFILEWITENCNPDVFDSNAALYASAVRMRFCVQYRFRKYKNVANPADSKNLRDYMTELRRRSVLNRKRSKGLSGKTIEEFRTLLDTLPADNATNTEPSPGWQCESIEHEATYAQTVIGFRATLGISRVLTLRVEDLSFSLHNNTTHLTINFSKTSRVQPMHFITETELEMIPYCVVGAVTRWMRISGVKDGYLFPKIYGNTLSPLVYMDSKDYLKNFRDFLAIVDVEEDVSCYTYHSVRQGGIIWMYHKYLNITRLMAQGRASNISPTVIMRYLVAEGV